MSKADERKDISVGEYLSTINDEGIRQDALKLMDIMFTVSGSEPLLYGIGTIGFGIYNYEYESGRKGEAHTLAFYPRKGKITIYLMDGTARYSDLLSQLGDHTITGYCVYVKKLSDVDLHVLKQIIQKSYDRIMSLSKHGPVDRILWQASE